MDGGAGPITSRLTTGFWRPLLAIVGRDHHRLLSLFGPAIIVITVANWILMLWTGWVLVFASNPDSLLHTSGSGGPADWPGRIWFVAYAISSLGNGDHTPNGDAWQIISSLTTLSSFFLASLVISYLLSVLSAVVQKRSFAAQVSAMGTTAEEFLENAWDGESFRTLELPLNSISGLLGTITEQYLSYPILQYYPSGRPAKSPAVGLAVLDDALTLIRFGVAREYRPNDAILHSSRSSVEGFLETLESAFIRPADEAPPPPNLERLRQAGIPTVTDGEFQRALDDLDDRRKRLYGLMLNDGWNWTDQ